MKPIRRRRFLAQSAGIAGAVSLGSPRFCGADSKQSRIGQPHFEGRAKTMIYLYMEGGPSQIDLFDPKPTLDKLAGKPLPFEAPSTVFNTGNKVFPSPFKFRQFGESGSWVSELLPNLAQCVDDLTFVHSMHHEVSNHSAACYLSHTGDAMAGRPSLGAWVNYGLGNLNQDLPGHVVLDCGQAPSGGAASWSHGFLPPDYSGVTFRKGTEPVEFIRPLEESRDEQQVKLNAIRQFQKASAAEAPHDGLVQSLEASYDVASRMQSIVPDVVGLQDESSLTRTMYGLDDPRTEVFGSRCLIARRLVEQGVRFIEVFSPPVQADRWDQHGQLEKGHRLNCAAVDRPIAGLIQDLKQRGLLDETIILWGGEFGRTPSAQGGNGRDHNPFGYTVFMAGGGLKPGYHHGTTDEFGYYAETKKVHLHDLHATLLHQLGLDHERLTYRFGGRDYRLTDVYGRVVKELLA